MDEVVLAINYQPEVMLEFVKEWESKLNIKITISKEDEPMGTAGPIALVSSTHIYKGCCLGLAWLESGFENPAASTPLGPADTPPLPLPPPI